MANINIPALNTFDTYLVEGDTNLSHKWDRWLERFDNYLIAVSVKEDARKRAIFLHCIGQLTFDIFQTLPDRGTRK